MKKILLSSILLASTAFAYDMGVNLGYSHFDISQSNSDNIILGKNTPSSTGYALEAFYSRDCLLVEDKSIKNYASINYAKHDDIAQYSFLAGLNKEYEKEDYTLYAGVLVGYGVLHYSYNPLNTTDKVDKDAGSFLYGLQGGMKYSLKNNYSLNLGIKHLIADYKTKLESNGATGNINHNNQSTFSIGLGYSF